MFGIVVNPAAIQAGDSIATKHRLEYDPKTDAHRPVVIKSRKVHRVDSCSNPEKIHLDNECYDTRFSTVIRSNK